MRRALTAASSGLLLILTFPSFDLAPLAWIALVPLLWVCAEEPIARRRFFYGWIAGVVFFLGTCYWCYGVMHHYGKLTVLESTGVLAAMVAGLALYVGLFAAVLPLAFENALEHPAWAIAGTAALWVACEFARGHIFIAFPWLFLGYAAADHLLLAKLAQITGVYGLSFVMAAFNAAIYLVIRSQRRDWGLRLAFAFFALAAIAGGGAFVAKDRPTEDAYLVQTAIPLDSEWSRESLEQFEREMQVKIVSRFARNGSRPGLIVWPEAPAPFYYGEDAELQAYLAKIARDTSSATVFSGIDFQGGDQQKPLNSAFGIGADGRLAAQYDKIELVPFGEHVPYASLFFFAGKLTAEVGDFVPGTRYQLLPGAGPSHVAAVICYEAAFPELVRELTRRGANAIVNVSNDGWFGDSPARRQHLLMARMRAIENDRWLIRATNDGLTAAISPEGRVVTFPAAVRDVFAARYGLKSTRTLYTEWGDWFPIGCVLLALAGVAINWRK